MMSSSLPTVYCFVIPAHGGIQGPTAEAVTLDPRFRKAFAGMREKADNPLI